MKTIREMHAAWAKAVMPPDAPAVQRQEMERAFYSGFFSAMKFMMEEVSSMPDRQAERALGAVQLEANDYFRLMSKIPGPHGTERQ